MGVREITEELEKLGEQIADFLEILGSGTRIRSIISNELRECKERFAVPRRTELVEFEMSQEDEDFIESEDMVVTVSHSGYIKRTPLAEFRSQKRGGKGLMGMTTKDEDFVSSQYIVNTHDSLLFFSTDGKVFKLKAWKLPKAGRSARGKPIINILPIETGSSVVAMTPIDVEEERWEDYQIAFASSDGRVRRNRLSDFANVRSNGKIAFDYPPGVSLVAARICSPGDDILLASAAGQAIRFSVDQVRISKSRKSAGVRGMRLRGEDKLVAMEIVAGFQATPEERQTYLSARRSEMSNGEIPEGVDRDRYRNMRDQEILLLTVTSTGSGKISSSHDYPAKGRGGIGVRAIRDAEIVAFLSVELDDQIILATESGKSIRCSMSEVSFRSRSAGGVKILRAADEDAVVAVATTGPEPEDENEDTPSA